MDSFATQRNATFGPVGAGSFVSISPDAFVRTELLFSGVIQIDADNTGWLI